MRIQNTYFYSNYLNKYSIIIKAINNIDEALTICMDNNTITSLKESRQLLCNEFSDMCKDIKIKDGIKTIDKNIVYYCNGLIDDRTDGIKTTVNPFTYQFNKNNIINTPTPEYNSFFRYGHNSPYRAVRESKKNCMPRSVSILINDYLFYKAGIKKTLKRPKLYELMNSMEKFIQSFDINNMNVDEKILSSVIKREVDAYKELNIKYNAAIYYAITGLYSNLKLKNTDNFYSKYEDGYNANFYGKVNTIFDERHSNCEFVIDNVELYHSNYRLKTERTILPYITETEAEEFLNIYNNTFKEFFNIYGLDDINHNKEKAENMAKDIAYDYYIKNYHTQDTDVYDDSYDKLGFMCMYYKYSDNDKTKVMDYVEEEAKKVLSHFLYDYIYIDTPDNIYVTKNKKNIIKNSMQLVNSVKYMLLNIKELYRLLYTIPNQDMHEFLIKKKVIIENYCPVKEMITNTDIIVEV